MKDVKNVLNGVQTVVLDLDGTLYNKQGLAKQMLRRLWWSLPLIAVDRLAKGACWRWLVRTRWYNRLWLPTMVEQIGKHCTVRKDVMALVEACRAQQIPMAVYSDYGAMREKLDVLGIDPKPFRLLVSAPEIGERKPSREAATKVLQMLKAAPETTLFVGDRDDTDGQTARLVGAKFLLV